MHNWDISEQEALQLQLQLAKKVKLEPITGKIDWVAGVDVAYSKSSDQLVAAVVTLNAQTLDVKEIAVHQCKVAFPYISGLFSFRELPPVLEALKKLKTKPDLIVCDGHGIAHPRRFGLASHLGVLIDTPSIGCAKTALLPANTNIDNKRGSVTEILHDNDIVGHVLRTQDNVKPVFVSPGHNITLQESVDWILKLAVKYRLPETTRHSDHEVKMALNKI